MHLVPKSTYTCAHHTVAHKTYKLPKINIKCMQANNKNRLSIMNGRRKRMSARESSCVIFFIQRMETHM